MTNIKKCGIIKICTGDKGVLNIVWDFFYNFFSYMWIYSIFEIYYLKIYTKYKKEVIVMAKILILFLLSAIALQGASMFLYLQYFRNNRLYKYI